MILLLLLIVYLFIYIFLKFTQVQVFHLASSRPEVIIGQIREENTTTTTNTTKKYSNTLEIYYNNGAIMIAIREKNGKQKIIPNNKPLISANLGDVIVYEVFWHDYYLEVGVGVVGGGFNFVCYDYSYLSEESSSLRFKAGFFFFFFFFFFYLFFSHFFFFFFFLKKRKLLSR